MNCRRARKLIPLLAGGELGGHRKTMVEEHLAGCPRCRQELEETRAALTWMRDSARVEKLDWGENEWNSLIAKARAQEVERRSPAFGLNPKTAWIGGVLLLMVAGSIVFFTRISRKPGLFVRLGETEVPVQTAPARASESEWMARALINDQPYASGLPRRKTPAVKPELLAGGAPQKATQDVLSVTLVSQETGLKVHWTFNRNFTWEEKKK